MALSVDHVVGRAVAVAVVGRMVVAFGDTMKACRRAVHLRTASLTQQILSQ
jgi:hypothetical protein